MSEAKLTTLRGVHEYCEGYAIELWRNEKHRLVVRARNEGYNNFTDVDLLELLKWAADNQEYWRGAVDE